jgi:hypothetical protein
VEIGLSISAVLSTLPKPKLDLSIVISPVPTKEVELIVFTSCIAVAPLEAPLRIVSKSEIVSCFLVIFSVLVLTCLLNVVTSVLVAAADA